jgi:ketosteroid isomerase-like protein
MNDAAKHDDTMRTLRELNARFIHNFVTNDVASHSALTHERFLHMTSKGAREGRASYLTRWSTGFDPAVIVYWDYRDERIDVFGDVALVRSTNKCVLHRDGKETTVWTTYTDTYLREDGTWRCIQAQITPVSPEHCPGDATIVRRYVSGVLQAA